MIKRKVKDIDSLHLKYPPSEPCSCEICNSYCKRPGWWTVEEASRAIDAGLSNRMMLEISPGFTFAVLSPSFNGNEVNFALQIFAERGCCFYKDNLCDLFGTGLQPLECRYCHHDRKGLGEKCHLDIEQDWNTREGKNLVVKWAELTGFYNRFQNFLAIQNKR